MLEVVKRKRWIEGDRKKQSELIEIEGMQRVVEPILESGWLA